MTVLDPTNPEAYAALEREFWQTLQQTFTDVLRIEPSLVDAYRAELQQASPYERLLALHDDPLDVAAVLTGITLTPEISSRYEEFLSHDPPTIALGSPPYFLIPRRRVLVSMEEVTRQMTNLGYRRVRPQRSRSRELAVERKSQSLEANAEVRNAATTHAAYRGRATGVRDE